MEGSKVVRLRRGGGWPKVSRWSRGRCRGSNKLPSQTSFHVTTLTSLYGQPCNLINCHERTTMLPETSLKLARVSWLSNFFARLSILVLQRWKFRRDKDATLHICWTLDIYLRITRWNYAKLFLRMQSLWNELDKIYKRYYVSISM